MAIQTLAMQPGATLVLPEASPGLNRTLYLFDGQTTHIEGRALAPKVGVRVRSDRPVRLENGPAPAQLLLLQARPIGEPVAKYGPFVMNTQAEIQQAFADYRRTRFGGWPWKQDDPVHGDEVVRFARHADGKVEKREA
jgi:hypothetical protein